MKLLVVINLILFFVIHAGLLFSQQTLVLRPSSTEGKDATVFSKFPDSNDDESENFIAYAWTYQGDAATKRSLIEFDMSEVPNDATVLSAELSLYYNPNDNVESFDLHTGDNPFMIQRVVSPWEEDEVTWNNFPGVTTMNEINMPATTSGTQDFIDIDVTRLVSDMMEQGNGNYGFLLRLVDELDYYQSILLASSDNANSDLHPKLVIHYTTNVTDCAIIQPSAIVGKDATVFSKFPDSNDDESENFIAYAWTYQGDVATKRSLIEFDMSEMPGEAMLLSAELSLYYNPNDDVESFDLHTGDNPFMIQRVVSPWEEDEVTWNNFPGVTTMNEVNMSATTSGTQNFIDIDVTKMVSDMIEPGNGNYGFLLRLVDELDYYQSILLASSDHDVAELRPKLRLCWEVPKITSAHDLSKAVEFEIFPNPTHSFFEIRMGECELFECKLEIFDMYGQMNNNYQASNNIVTIYNPGIYLVRLTHRDGGVFSKKVMVH